MYVAENIQICHVLQGGEYQVGSYFLDGCAVSGGVPTAFESNGCFFHGCVKCYHGNDGNPLVGVTVGYLYYTTQQKMNHLKRAGFNSSPVWEQEWVAAAQ